jgi:hypothetical protein
MSQVAFQITRLNIVEKSDNRYIFYCSRQQSMTGIIEKNNINAFVFPQHVFYLSNLGEGQTTVVSQ